MNSSLFSRLRGAIVQAFRVLANPEKEFKALSEKTFEKSVEEYLLLLVVIALLTGLASFVYSIGKAVYLNLALEVDVQYWRIANYSMGRSTSYIFLFAFVGTFAVFFLSMVLRIFFKRMKYVRLLQIMFYSLTPLLVFVWLPISLMGLLIWTIILFIVGIRAQGGDDPIKRGSIRQRD